MQLRNMCVVETLYCPKNKPRRDKPDDLFTINSLFTAA